MRGVRPVEPWWINSMYFIASSFVGMVAYETNGERRDRQHAGEKRRRRARSRPPRCARAQDTAAG